jgi:hypothetical protein
MEEQMTTEDIKSLADRVEELENKLYRIKFGGAVFLIVIALIGLIGIWLR